MAERDEHDERVDRCQAISKDSPCPNRAIRNVNGFWLCRDHLNCVKDGIHVKLQDGESVVLQ